MTNLEKLVNKAERLLAQGFSKDEISTVWKRRNGGISDNVIDAALRSVSPNSVRYYQEWVYNNL